MKLLRVILIFSGIIIIAIGIIWGVEKIGTITDDGPFYGNKIYQAANPELIFDTIHCRMVDLKFIKSVGQNFPVLVGEHGEFKKWQIGMNEIESSKLYSEFKFKQIKFLKTKSWLWGELVEFQIEWDDYQTDGYLFLSPFGYFRKYYIVYNW